MRDFFGNIARWTAEALGSPSAFVFAAAAVVAWLALGPIFGWSSGWQLLINTATTIITFLMVFVIQNAVNRDTRAIQIKLDELLRAVASARTGFVDIEDLTDDELARLQERFAALRELHAEETEVVEREVEESVALGASEGRG